MGARNVHRRLAVGLISHYSWGAMPDVDAAPGPAGQPAGLLLGATTAWRGLQLALGAPQVKRTYLQLTTVILLLVLSLDVLGIWAVWSWTGGDGSESWWAALALVLLRIAGIGVVLLIAPILAMFVVDMLFPLLSERVFLAGMSTVAPDRATELAQIEGLPFTKALAQNFIRLLLFLGLSVVTFGISLIPVAGAIAGPALQVYFTSRALGWELLDPYFEKLSLSFDEQHRFVREHRNPLLGFALPFSFILAIPLVGPFVFGLAQAAAGVLVAEVIEGPQASPAQASR